MTSLPVGWRVVAVGPSVHFEVPASAADGEFQLAPTDALLAGLALVRSAERARMLGNVADEGLSEGERLRRVRDALDVLAAASSSAAEDQAWVDDISDFGDEEAASDPKSGSGEGE